MDSVTKLLLQLGGAAGAIMAIVGFAAWLDIATGGDLKKLDCKFAPAAVAAFSAQQQNLLVIKPSEDPQSQNAYKMLLKQAERNLDEAVDHQIKCGR